MEMGRGEVDYDAVFAALASVGFDGVISSCVFGWEEDARGVSERQRDKALALIGKHFGDDRQPPCRAAQTLDKDTDHGNDAPSLEGRRRLRGHSGRFSDVTNPATGEVTAQLALASEEDVNEVVAAALAAFPSWRDTSLAKRTQILFAFRELLNERKKELAAIITSEHGKVLSDALGEVSRGQEVVEFACGIAHLIKGDFTENASTKVDVHSARQPLGVAGIISPFNFPAMVPMWFFPIAIAAGNTVVLKPSEKVPTAALWMAELWKEAGLPDGVFNVLNGDKVAVDGLLTHPDVQSISFVGSTPIARYVYETGTTHGKRVQALGGAKNHMLVLPDADLDLAADQAINAGSGRRGSAAWRSPRCWPSAISVTSWWPRSGRAMSLRTGDGTRGCDMGPLVTSQAKERVSGYIDAGEAAERHLSWTGGSRRWMPMVTASSSGRRCSIM